MLPLVCNDAVAILFMFDLSRKSTLNSVKEWYRQARGFNKARFDLNTYYSSISNRLAPSDRNTFPHRHQVRYVRKFLYRRARRDHKAGQAVCKSHARIPYLLLDRCFYQCPEDIQDCPRESL